LGLTEDPRIAQLEEQFKRVTTDLNSSISKITKQQALSDANFQKFFHMLKQSPLITDSQEQASCAPPNAPSSIMSNTPKAQANHLHMSEGAGVSLGDTSQGS